MRLLIALLPMLLLVAGCDRQSADAPQAAPTATAAAEAEPTSSVDTSHRGQPAPADSFAGPDGKPVSLVSFKGKPVLVNLWATWCGPCVREMPALDAVAARAGDRMAVLVVSQDRADVAIAPVFEKRGLKTLEQYRDPDNKLGFAFATGMLPTTVLFDTEGKEVWRIAGAMDWEGPRGRKLLAGLAD